MQLIQIEPPIEQVITTEEAKLWLRVDADDEDETIAALIAAATSRFDGRDGVLGRCLAPQTWRLELPRFPWGEIKLPLPPTISIEAVEYTDRNGQTQELQDCRTALGGWSGARILPALGGAWPGTADVPDAVRVRFRAGYQTDASPAELAVPEAIKQAMLLLITDWFEERRNFTVGGTMSSLPVATEALIAPFRANYVI